MIVEVIIAFTVLYFSLLIYVVCKELLESLKSKIKLVISKIKGDKKDEN